MNGSDSDVLSGIASHPSQTTTAPIPCRLHVRRIPEPVATPALSRIFAAMEDPAILGANSAVAQAKGVSCWASRPREVFEFRDGNDPFEGLQRALDKYRLVDNCDCPLPPGAFRGGWIGYFGYELGRYIERLPETTTDDLGMPLIRLGFYDRFVCCDHGTGTSYAAMLEIPGSDESVQAGLDALEALVERARGMIEPELPEADIEDISLERVRCNMDRPYYLHALARIKQYILDGDVYQINFSQRFACEFTASPINLFAWQNRFNASPFAAYLDDGEFRIVSASPEMFITLCDGWISTRPIKGTRIRLDEKTDPHAAALNTTALQTLIDSPKERAELNMIIDLERNDLARICEPGTRKVVEPRTVEAYPTVFHAMATVKGRVHRDLGFCDVLRAVFPGGSITGAPKIRAMEIIDETEPTARGVYTGSIGFVGIDGNACLNIAIRTIIICRRRAFVQTGGGIVADSDPQAEWTETLTKARALLAGIRAVQG